MSNSQEHTKYKWTPDSTALLVSVWSDRQVQKQLEYTSKPQVIWENIARYMKRKGYNVTSKNCRSRMKQLLVCYQEAKRAGTQAGVDQYYESIDKVLKSRKVLHVNDNGVDTVDAVNMKSPPKDVKTNKNMQMQNKYNPVESQYRTEALSPTWITGQENEYPDSPESNETVVARPCGVFSPTRDIGINTGEHLTHLNKQTIQRNYVPEDLRDDFRHNVLTTYQYEIPYQNTVQNVQNQIIQENMQQHQTVLHQNPAWNQRQQQNAISQNLNYQPNLYNMHQNMGIQTVIDQPPNFVSMPNPNIENMIRQNNKLQQNAMINNNAMPQEPRKIVFGKNLAATYKRYRDTIPQYAYQTEMKQSGSLTPDYSSDTAPNLNDAFCQTMESEAKIHNLNETFTRPSQGNPQLLPETTVLTTNATYNDDSFVLELMADSPVQSEAENKLRETAVNTDDIPSAPLRKKKAQKLEQLVLNAINSQNEVVNKILSAQNDMVERFLDAGKDRQDRLENRLEQLLNVVHSSVLKNNPEAEHEASPPPREPIITCLSPPPKPGVVPPKLDLVPPKPCRVPCTVASSTTGLINQNPITTRPGVVSPINSPGRKFGTIWTKLGPVSQSPFVRAQRRLGLQPNYNGDLHVRTQSSAERRIAKEVERIPMDIQNLIFETTKFLEMERYVEEKIESARREGAEQILATQKKLLEEREPTAAMILTSAFLESERQEAGRAAVRFVAPNFQKPHARRSLNEELLGGQGESYNRLKQLNAQSNYVIDDPSDSSTPAKGPPKPPRSSEEINQNSKQTIQQLAQLVMNSQRWKDAAAQNQQRQSEQQRQLNDEIKRNQNNNRYSISAFAPKSGITEKKILESEEPVKYSWKNKESTDGEYATNIYNDQQKQQELSLVSPPPPPKPQFPMGFTTALLDTAPLKQNIIDPNSVGKIGFVEKVISDGKPNVHFIDDALTELQKMYAQKLLLLEAREGQIPFMRNNDEVVAAQHHQLIEKYMQEIMPKKIKDGKDTDSDNDEDFLDTTGTLQPASGSRKGSLTSIGTGSSGIGSLKFGKPGGNCIVS